MLCFLLTTNLDLVWVPKSALDVVFQLPTSVGFLVRVHRKNIRTGMLRRVRRSSGTSLVVLTGTLHFKIVWRTVDE